MTRIAAHAFRPGAAAAAFALFLAAAPPAPAAESEKAAPKFTLPTVTVQDVLEAGKLAANPRAAYRRYERARRRQQEYRLLLEYARRVEVERSRLLEEEANGPRWFRPAPTKPEEGPEPPAKPAKKITLPSVKITLTDVLRTGKAVANPGAAYMRFQEERRRRAELERLLQLIEERERLELLREQELHAWLEPRWFRPQRDPRLYLPPDEVWRQYAEPPRSRWFRPAAPNWYFQLLPYLEQEPRAWEWRYLDYTVRGPAQLRLGAEVKPADAALAAQLGLPKGAGQVLGEVSPDSPAGKAGFRSYDVLLELDGKPVPDNADAFARLLDGLKPDIAAEAVVVRQGKRLTVPGVKLPAPPRNVQLFNPGDGASNTLLFGERYSLPPGDWGAPPRAPKGYEVRSSGDVLATTFRHEDRFTSRLQEGSLVITITGTVKDGKAVVGGVKVQDGGVESRYPSLDKVPPEYRDKAAGLLAEK
jgi:hypothetical protein